MTISEQIDQFIAENGGNTRDALNVALERLKQMEMKLTAVKANAEMEVAKARLNATRELLDILIKKEQEQETDTVIEIYRPPNLPDSQ